MRALAVAVALASTSFAAFAQDVLIRNATVHTAGAQGTLKNADVLVRNGVVQSVGSGLAAPGATVVEANGRPLTPAFFGGITEIGVEEVSGESATADSAVTLEDQPMRPEFDVTLAYNPASVVIPVARVEGIGFTLLGASTGGSFIAGQGGVMRLDGSADPVGPRALFVRLGGGGAADLAGKSRAAQWMLLDQMVAEARGRVAVDSPHALLTPAGRATLARYLAGNGRIVVQVNRAADIRQLLRWAQRENVRIAIAGGAEAWKLAPQLAQAKVPVFVDALADLPADFDQIGATLENAARLDSAGVPVGFSQVGESHNARKNRQLAGNAVANGLPWEDGLAGLTRVPAEAFGVGDRIGTIAPGKLADLVLWTADPLDVSSTAEQVWLGGRAMPMRSRQTELRDRYLQQAGPLPRAYSK
ncbi:amidohydrolase family protein [Pseudoxanthomonas sp. PXM02]|uniref:amidohydrolase family protein n=1 Tax=Pseudoxanthomonas sp. PXM02 TaxID=2769294 RepID=UPI001780A979|nr:amidohydrolase family protein [Pseudoxanthomonas sp. PXM02]MBD9480330.1 amidohydrolase family protein [Pseudoxanthomonas sp. PXM02]